MSTAKFDVALNMTHELTVSTYVRFQKEMVMQIRIYYSGVLQYATETRINSVRIADIWRDYSRMRI